MATFYSVIRFVPDPIRDEALNVGIVVARGETILVHLVDDWSRLKYFAGAHWRSMRQTLREFAGNPHDFLGLAAVAERKAFESRLAGWTHSLQFSDVRVSTDMPQDLLEKLSDVFLWQEARAEDASSRRRRALVDSVDGALRSAFTLRFERQPRGMVKRHARVPGKKAAHKVDVGLVNGTAYAAAFALTFATDQTERQWRDTDAVAFAIDDIYATGSKIPIAAVMDPPPSATEPYERARRLLSSFPIEIVEAADVSPWAARAVRTIPDQAVN